MANTFLCFGEADLNDAAVTVAALWNDSGGTNVLRVRRMGVIGMDDGATTGMGFTVLSLWLYGATVSYTAGTAGTEYAMNSTYSSPAHLVAGWGGNPPTTTGSTGLLRRVLWNSTVPTLDGESCGEWQVMVPFGVVFDAGIEDTALQPIVLRQDEGLFMFRSDQVDNSLQWYFEVTAEAS